MVEHLKTPNSSISKVRIYKCIVYFLKVKYIENYLKFASKKAALLNKAQMARQTSFTLSQNEV